MAGPAYRSDPGIAQTRVTFCTGRDKAVLVNVWLDHSDFREGSISM
jgi:hypothetical protein